MEFSGFFVCAQCKPIAVSKLARDEVVGTIWRDGDRLVLLRTETLPDRCIHCNKPTQGGRSKRTFTGYHPVFLLPAVSCFGAAYLLKVPQGLLFLGALLILIISTIAVRHTATIELPICLSHQNRQAKRRIVGFALIPVAIGLILVTPVYDWLLIPAVIFLIAGLIWALGGTQLSTFAKITKTHVFLDGVSPAFLAEFPEWPRR